MVQLLHCGILGILLAASAPGPESMRDLIERWVTDRQAIESFHRLPLSPRRGEVLGAFYDDWIRRLDAVDFDALDRDGRVDWLLLKGEIEFRKRELAKETRERERLLRLLPFAPDILGLEEARQRMEAVGGREAADRLVACKAAIKAIKGEVEKALQAPESAAAESRAAGALPVDAECAWRAADSARALRGVLESWHGSRASYDPDIAWWTKAPVDAVLAALDDYATFLRQKVAKASGDEGDPLFGEPIGREALLSALRHERIAYTPDELIAIGSRHAAWCVGEMKRAAAAMGLGDDWKKAIEKTKANCVAPGKQPELVERLAKEAIEFCDKNELVTIPQLCRDTWRIEMISGAGQKHLPFASYGGSAINVAYPTAEMDHERKLMAMRGNNCHFSRLVVAPRADSGAPPAALRGRAREAVAAPRLLDAVPRRGLGRLRRDALLRARLRARPRRTSSAPCSGGCTAARASSFRCATTSARWRPRRWSTTSWTRWASSATARRRRCVAISAEATARSTSAATSSARSRSGGSARSSTSAAR